MIFSSKVFLFFFLPCVLLGYFLVHKKRALSNLFLTLASLLFYAWGEPRFVLIMLLSIVMNWLFGLWVDKERENKKRAKAIIALMCVYNLGVLGVFKYLSFILTNVKAVFSASFSVPQIALPIGISFFTFQAMSYVIDVYRGDGHVQKNLVNVCLYISFFPQLIAGPIVRYQTVAKEITDRKETLTDFTLGMRRFLVGLCKKVLLANELALLVDTIFALDNASLSTTSAWIGAVAYLMQVYYDFSGYSDMAIGLGRMFGFHFAENFDYPWLSKSVAGFWRRWHISMCTWFRDYLYFPLGGSRVKSKARLLFNMFMVWAMTGLWHGAAWTYVLWGIAFFVLQAFERVSGFGAYIEKKGGWGILYAMFTVVTVTVMIRSASLASAGTFYRAMFGGAGAGLYDVRATMFLREYAVCLILGVVCGLPWRNILVEKHHFSGNAFEIISAVGIAVLTVLSFASLAVAGYNPFIYFNF